MVSSRLALAAPFLIASVSAYGNSVIKNSCGTTVYFVEDGESALPMASILPGQSFTKELYQTGKANGAGPSFKCAAAHPDGSLPNVFSDPTTQFEYTVNAPTWPGFVSFDISNVNGNGNPPFVAGGVSISSPQDPGCSKTCGAGVNPCTQGYTVWNDDKWAMVQTAMNNDIVMELCGPKPGTNIPEDGSKGGSSGGSQNDNSPPPSSTTPPPAPPSSSAPPPPPSSSAAAPVQPPVQEKVAQNNQNSPPAQEPDTTKVVWVTTYAPAETVVVHVTAPAVNAKREEHIHNHAHAHNKINKRRHGA